MLEYILFLLQYKALKTNNFQGLHQILYKNFSSNTMIFIFSFLGRGVQAGLVNKCFKVLFKIIYFIFCCNFIIIIKLNFYLLILLGGFT
jgi:hypothetical protein